MSQEKALYTYNPDTGMMEPANEAARQDTENQEKLEKDLQDGKVRVAIHTPGIKMELPQDEQPLKITDESLKTKVEYNEDGTVKNTTTTRDLDMKYEEQATTKNPQG